MRIVSTQSIMLCACLSPASNVEEKYEGHGSGITSGTKSKLQRIIFAFFPSCTIRNKTQCSRRSTWIVLHKTILSGRQRPVAWPLFSRKFPFECHWKVGKKMESTDVRRLSKKRQIIGKQRRRFTHREYLIKWFSYFWRKNWIFKRSLLAFSTSPLLLPSRMEK